MVELGRWTNAVIHIVNAIEILVKEERPILQRDKGKLLDAIDKFCMTYNNSKKFKKRGIYFEKKEMTIYMIPSFRKIIMRKY